MIHAVIVDIPVNGVRAVFRYQRYPVPANIQHKRRPIILYHRVRIAVSDHQRIWQQNIVIGRTFPIQIPLCSMIPPVYYRRMAPLDKNSAILLSLLRALSGLDKNFPLPYAVFLLEVARNEGCSLGDLQKATGMPLPTLSRILSALSTQTPERRRAVPADRAGLRAGQSPAESHPAFGQGAEVHLPGERHPGSNRGLNTSENARQFSLAAAMWPARRNR